MDRFGTWFVQLGLMLVVGLVAAGCTDSDRGASGSSQRPAPVATEVPEPVETAHTVPAPEPIALAPTTAPIEDLPDVAAAQDVAAAPLGTFVVARPGAGITRVEADGTESLEIPVYHSPFGPPRALLDVDPFAAEHSLFQLRNWSENDGALVLRVLAGGPDDGWLRVQAPVRPHDQWVWVRRNDFDFGFTTKRIEIDLAEGGSLQLFDGDDIVLESSLVQGRDARPTPVHLTYIEGGVAGDSLSPAYGAAVLSMASFSEALGSFDGGLPADFIHGTNQPNLMGQRVSSGEIRLPDDVITRLVASIEPGTPVLIYDSSNERPGREQILARRPSPAQTVAFVGTEILGRLGLREAHKVAMVRPQLWQRCAETEPLFCRNQILGLDS